MTGETPMAVPYSHIIDAGTLPIEHLQRERISTRLDHLDKRALALNDMAKMFGDVGLQHTYVS
jgi:hypothetical protein